MGLATYPQIHGLLSNDRYADILPGYAGLYNWYAVRKIVVVGGFNVYGLPPAGWRVMTIVDWQALANRMNSEYGGGYSGGTPPYYTVVGGALKGTGTTYWSDPNTEAANYISFTARPAGLRGADGSFTVYNNLQNMWWTSDDTTNPAPFTYRVDYNTGRLWVPGAYKNSGLSVRLVRDEAYPGDEHYLPSPAILEDYDGNEYPIIKSGAYAGNLIMTGADWKSTHYVDGSSIPYLGNNVDWALDTTGAYCAYYP